MCPRVFAYALLVGLAACTTEYFVNTTTIVGKWDHYFEQCVGSCHAATALRADWQRQMTKTHTDIGFRQVRFHGLFIDDMSVVLPGDNGTLLFSFLNIDEIFDFLHSIGMRPFVEIGFMPELLASGTKTWAHFKANITPPKDYAQWASLITAFFKHLIERYGLAEILQWNFEVWNEPNCCPHDFWTGSEADYFHLYEVTARAAKAVHPGIRIGGPVTAMSAWVDDFIDYCKKNNVPYDFVSTHEYPTDPPGPETRTFFRDTLVRTRKSVTYEKPLYYTVWLEYDDGYNDATSYAAAFAVVQAYAAQGVVDVLSWWPFSDIFEEAGLRPDLFNPVWMPVAGLQNVRGIPKPSYRAFQLLHWSGTQLVETRPDFWAHPTVGVFAVSGNGTFVFMANWQVKRSAEIQTEGLHITVGGVAAARASARLYRIDGDHATAFSLWVRMGSPTYLTASQVAQLTAASELTPEPLSLRVAAADAVSFDAVLPPNALAVAIINA